MLDDKVNKMIEENIKLVPSVVWSKFKTDISMDSSLLDEYIGVGNIALIKACQNFDESLGYAFSTYAVPIIWGEIQKFRRDKRSNIRLPRRLHKAGTEYSKGAALNKDIETICKETGIFKEDIEEWLISKDVIKLDTPLSDDSDVSRLDMLTDNFDIEDSVIKDIKHKEKMEILEKVLKPLEFKCVKLVESGIYRQMDLAEKLGMSQAQVSRILKKLTGLVGPAVEEYYSERISWNELCKKLNIEGRKLNIKEKPKEVKIMEFSKEIDAICSWLINNPGEELNLGKVLKEAGMDRSTYHRVKIKNMVLKEMIAKEYNIKEVPYGAKGSTRLLLESSDKPNIVKSITKSIKSDNVLLNILDIPISTCDLEFTEALQKSLLMFTMLGKSAVLDIKVREVS